MALIRTGSPLVAWVMAAALLAGCGDDAKTPDAAKQTTAQAEEKPLFSPVPCVDYVEAPGPRAASQAEGLSPELAAAYARSCKICHENPGAGAPLTGKSEQWAARVAQGRNVLLEHTVNGYQGMPPLGLCMDCSEADFAALIEYMAGEGLK